MEEDLNNNNSISPNNTLNDLSGKEWLKFLKSWFIHDGPQRSKDETLHPAKYPEDMIVNFIKFFTKEGQYVLDPFLGTGSTLVACLWTGRNGIGIEINEKYAKIAESRVEQKSLRYNNIQKVVVGNSLKIEELWQNNNLQNVDFIICSPPYWNMLKKSRGGVQSAQRDREDKGLDTYYSEDPNDLGNIDDYYIFVEKLTEVFRKSLEFLNYGKYMVIIIQNLRDEEGIVRPLAWDLTREISKLPDIVFQGEKIWCQNNKKLGIWGYPKIFVPSYHHHYCLIFQKK